MVFDVSSHHGFRATTFDAAIATDDVVVADAIWVATGTMPFVNLLGAAGLVGLDSRAVDDE